MRKVFFWLLFIFSSVGSWAQQLTFSGRVSDAITGQALPGATVYLPQIQKGSVTNADGLFTISNLPAGSQQLKASFVGYRSYISTISLKADTLVHLLLEPAQEQLQALVVEASATSTYRSNLTSVTHLRPEDIQKAIGMLGEADLVKTLQLKPGVQSGGEGSSGFFVRGGQADQNLVLLDGVSIYNPSHLFGMFSVFNSDMLQDVKLYKGS